jgi:hypothetical protein
MSSFFLLTRFIAECVVGLFAGFLFNKAYKPCLLKVDGDYVPFLVCVRLVTLTRFEIAGVCAVFVAC